MQFMSAFDRAMNSLDEKFSFLASGKQIVSSTDEDNKVQSSKVQTLGLWDAVASLCSNRVLCAHHSTS